MVGDILSLFGGWHILGYLVCPRCARGRHRSRLGRELRRHGAGAGSEGAYSLFDLLAHVGAVGVGPSFGPPTTPCVVV
jgi:hypothetical protein